MDATNTPPTISKQGNSEAKEPSYAELHDSGETRRMYENLYYRVHSGKLIAERPPIVPADNC